MSNERAILCGGTSARGLPTGTRDPVELALWGDGKNVSLDIANLTWPLLASVPAQFMDLIEIATYVYCADQAITRGGDGVDNLGADWRRRLYFRIPVREPDRWSAPEMLTALTTTLGFLSDDEYVFDFTELKQTQGGDGFLFEMTHEIDEVVLFSGGLDSLAGAVREAVTGERRVALVRHRPTTKLESRHSKLTSMLDEKCAHAPLYITVGINKEDRLSREYTQRARSFLYLALGATVAVMLGKSRVRFYENGVVSLNLPLSAQLVGSKATRTTHPRVLRGFGEIVSALTESSFHVQNQFLWMTKTDVVRTITNAGCGELVNYSTSCAHTWEQTLFHPHCGRCSQCIDRRFAVLAAQAFEDSESYGVDLLTGKREPPADCGDQAKRRWAEDRSTLASYVEAARRVAQMAPEEFFARYGEASRVYRHVDEPPQIAQQRIYEMYHRHAQEVCGVLESAVANHASAILNRTLHATCLLRLVADSAAAAAAVADDGPEADGAGSSSAFCLVTSAEGSRLLSQPEYKDLVRAREDFDMFIDGTTRDALVRENNSTIRTDTLRPRELAILCEYITTQKALRPRATSAGGSSTSAKASFKLFTDARRKVDVRLGGSKYRAFRLHQDPTDPDRNAYQFAPPQALKYCLIEPITT